MPSDAYRGWVYRIWDALARYGTVFYISRNRIAGTCPRCGEPIGIQFVDSAPPLAKFTCHGAGCTSAEIFEAIAG